MSAARIRSIESSRRPVTRPAGGAYVGRGVVTAVLEGGAGVTVSLADGREVDAVPATALPYAACEGDILLVIGQDEFFVVGVVSGRGKTALELHGDVSLRALSGRLELSGDEGVVVRGPEVEVHADKLRTVARSVVETVASFFQRVTEVLHVHAQQQVTIVDDGSYQQAKTTAIQTEETVTINGKEIHLG
jgi:hypothetical protein